MPDGIDMIGTEAGAGAARRAVNAESFRRLTALLKKPAAAVIIPDLSPVLPPRPAPAPQAEPVHETVQVAEATPVAPDLPLPLEAAPEAEPVEFAAPDFAPAPPEAEQEPEATPVLEGMAEQTHAEPLPEAPVALAEPEVEPEALNAEPVAEDVAVPEPEPEAATEPGALSAEPVAEEVAVSEPEPEAATEPEALSVEPVAEEVAVSEPEPEAATEPEVLSSEPEAAAQPVEPETQPIEAAPVEEPAAPPPVAEAQKPFAGFPESRAVAARLAPARSRAPDAFSLIPEAQAARAEPEIQQTPEQEAESADLAQSLMDMMAASAGGGQPQERALASDTLLRLLPRLPVRTRTTLAQRITMMDAPPPFLVAKLIADRELAVSGPMLEDCMHISDEDLLQVVASGNPDKRRLIARRRRISRPVSEALAATGDQSVLLTLVRNQGAEIASEGFVLLAQAAAQNSELLAPLCTRQDLPVHFAFELFWLAPAQLRRYLLSRFLTDSENLTKILRITMDSHGEAPSAEAGIDLATIGQALLTFMAADTSVAARDEQINLLAAAAKLKAATVERILQDDQGEPLMALLKVLGVPRSMLEAEMHQFASGSLHLIDPARNLSEVQAVFDQLSFTKARILLTYWDWATTNSGPYAAIN